MTGRGGLGSVRVFVWVVVRVVVRSAAGRGCARGRVRKMDGGGRRERREGEMVSSIGGLLRGWVGGLMMERGGVICGELLLRGRLEGRELSSFESAWVGLWSMSGMDGEGSVESGSTLIR